MAHNHTRGWHGDSEEHARAARGEEVTNHNTREHDEETHKSNWLPLLLIPLALVVGWVAGNNMHPNYTGQGQTVAGQGGGPGTTVAPCPSSSTYGTGQNGTVGQ